MSTSYLTPLASSNDVTVGSQPPGSPRKGNLWVDNDGFFLYVYDGARWIGLSDDGNMNKITYMQDTRPEPTSHGGTELSIIPGTLWFNTDSMELFIFYDDGDTSQWISTTNNGLNYRPADKTLAELKIEQDSLQQELAELYDIVRSYTNK